MYQNMQTIFIEEATDLLEELEEAFLELENDTKNMDIINRIFRAMHTIKGSGSMCGFTNLSKFTHEFETAFDRVRNGEIIVTKELIEIGLDSHSFIEKVIKSLDHINPTLREESKEILQMLHKYSPQKEEDIPQGINIDLSTPDEDVALDWAHYRIRFIPDKNVLTMAMNPLALIDCLMDLGEVRSVAYVNEIPDLDEIDETACYLSWEIIISTQQGKDDIIEIFEFIEDDCELKVDVINQESDFENDYKRLGDILIERGDLTEEQLAALFEEKPLAGELIKESGLVPQEKIDSALLEQEVVRSERDQKKQAVASDNIRVSSARLDMQMDLIGELVISLASLNQLALEQNDSKLNAISEELDSLVTNIRDNVLGIRMLPIGSTFSKFRRLVRDLSSEQGKKIEMLTFGADTELDKMVIDQLSDPLVHLIRNSLDHGIELPAVRQASGKDESGTITLTAKHAHGHVLIEIKDDGKGIDPEIIWNKALEKNFAKAGEKPSDREILQYIFEPGFSTADTVSNISGRGVGMDVVKRSIESLRGSILMESILGKGTTITLQLPLTLAIIEGLLVSVGSESLVIPLSMVVECVETKKSKLQSSKRGQLIRVRDTLIPCLPLQNWVGEQSTMPEDIQVIIVNIDDERYGLIINDVIGQQQIVIKSLGDIYKTIAGVSGATILGDGSVALILDLPQIVQLFEVAERI
ncbi:chemotaxis protein CheA [Colwellia piezophila]|uniref:chemotaxis protein CheA n=1 Tax=Colwellia piezophila TaxID=211668 RepID=UPI0003799755|nr:chemotaxis protein CheA [Colwellia piezophila]